MPSSCNISIRIESCRLVDAASSGRISQTMQTAHAIVACHLEFADAPSVVKSSRSYRYPIICNYDSPWLRFLRTEMCRLWLNGIFPHWNMRPSHHLWVSIRAPNAPRRPKHGISRNLWVPRTPKDMNLHHRGPNGGALSVAKSSHGYISCARKGVAHDRMADPRARPCGYPTIFGCLRYPKMMR